MKSSSCLILFAIFLFIQLIIATQLTNDDADDDLLYLNVLPTGITLGMTHINGHFECRRDLCFVGYESFVIKIPTLPSIGIPATYSISFFQNDVYEGLHTYYYGYFRGGIMVPIDVRPFNKFFRSGDKFQFVVELKWKVATENIPNPVKIDISLGPTDNATESSAFINFVYKATDHVFSAKNTAVFHRIVPNPPEEGLSIYNSNSNNDSFYPNNNNNNDDDTAATALTIAQPQLDDVSFRFETRIKNVKVSAQKFLIYTYGSLVIPDQETILDPQQKVQCEINGISLDLEPQERADESPFYWLLATFPQVYGNDTSLPADVDVFLQCTGIRLVTTNTLYGITVQFIDKNVSPKDYEIQPQFTVLSNDSIQPLVLDITTKQYDSYIKPRVYDVLHSGIIHENNYDTKNTRWYSQYRYYIRLETTNMHVAKNITIDIQMQNVKDLDLVDDKALYYFGAERLSHESPHVFPQVARYGSIHESKAKNQQQTITQSIFYWKTFTPSLHKQQIRDMDPSRGGYIIIDIMLEHIKKDIHFTPPTFVFTVNQPYMGTSQTRKMISMEAAASISLYNKPVTESFKNLDFRAESFTFSNKNDSGDGYHFNMTIANLLHDSPTISFDIAVREFEFAPALISGYSACKINNMTAVPTDFWLSPAVGPQQALFFSYPFKAGETYRFSCGKNVVLQPTFSRRTYSKISSGNEHNIPIHVFAYDTTDMTTGSFSYNYLKVRSITPLWVKIVGAIFVMLLLVALIAAFYHFVYVRYWRDRQFEIKPQQIQSDSLIIPGQSIDAAAAFGENVEYDRLL